MKKKIHMKEGLFAEVGHTLHKSNDGRLRYIPLFMEVPSDNPDERDSLVKICKEIGTPRMVSIEALNHNPSKEECAQWTDLHRKATVAILEKLDDLPHLEFMNEAASYLLLVENWERAMREQLIKDHIGKENAKDDADKREKD